MNRFSAEERSKMQEEELRLFPQPQKNASLWRYLETYKFQDLLETSTLYLCQVSTLEKMDPHEGLMNRLQIEALRTSLKGDSTRFEEFVRFHERIRHNSWVTCFSLADFEEAHMWRRFCNSTPSEGVAVKTTHQKLFSATDTCPEADAPYIAKVRYDQTDYMPWKIGYLLYQKLPEFSDEREVRVCVCKPDPPPTESPNHVRVPVLLGNLVQNIRVHPRASDSYFREIQKLVSKHLPKKQGRVEWSRLRSRL